MSGKKAKARRRQLAADIAAWRKLPARFVETTNDGNDEVWTRGKIMFVIPAIRDEYPAEIKNALKRRRDADLNNRCECGAAPSNKKPKPGKIKTGDFLHEEWCNADTDSIVGLFRQYGIIGQH